MQVPDITPHASPMRRIWIAQLCRAQRWICRLCEWPLDNKVNLQQVPVLYREAGPEWIIWIAQAMQQALRRLWPRCQQAADLMVLATMRCKSCRMLRWCHPGGYGR